MTEQFDRTIELRVSGMTCHNCVNHVTEELQELDSVSKVSVVLDSAGTSSVLVVTDSDITDENLKKAVAEAGDYTIEDIIR